MKVQANILFCDRRRAHRFVPALGLAVCLLLLALPLCSFAQEFRATLTGEVRDPDGRAVVDATVTATNVETGSTYTGKTSNAGVYYIPYVVPGTYTVKANATGFKTAVQDNVLLLAGKYFGQNFKLSVGEVRETMEVTAAPPLLETENASGGTILDANTLQNVPVNGNQVYMMIGTVPGSQFTQTTFGPGGFSGTRGWDVNNQYIIGGGVNPADTSGGFNQFTLNGGNITQQFTYNSSNAGTWNVAPNLDAVQEVNVMTTTYDARFGRTSGGTVTMVTKNGTNSYHGEVFENYKDGKLFDANTIQNVFVSGLPAQQQVENDFGGTFGGPIKKDKLWFFFSFEGYRQSIYNLVTGNVPPAYLRPGYNGNSGVDFGLVQGIYKQLNPQSPYALYGLTLFQPGDSNNPSNSNNAQCFGNGPGAAATGPANQCGANTLGFPNAYTGGTVQLSGQQGSLLPAAQLNPTALSMLTAGYIPLPNIRGAENYIGGFGDPANYAAVSPDVYRYNQPMIRVDYNSSDKTKWYSFFEWQKGWENRSTNGFTGLEANGNLDHYRENWQAIQDMTHTFSPTLLADFKISFSRFVDYAPDGNLNLAQPPSKLGLTLPLPPTTAVKTFPEYTIGAGVSNLPGNFNGGVSTGTLFGNSLGVSATTNIMLDADFTKSKGAHNIHFGGGVGEFFFGNPGNAGNANGAFSFTGQWTQYDSSNQFCYEPASLGFASGSPACSAGSYAPNGSGWADFLLGLPANPKTGPNSHIDWNDSLFDYEPVWYLYGQDDWKVTRRLTLNLGLRYDVQVGLRERYNELTRGVCLTCINPVTNDGVYQANVANSANQAAWQAVAQAAGFAVPNLKTVYGGPVYAGHNGQTRDAYNTDYTNIAPRIGAAFAINSKTVVRGGWGLFYSGGLEGGSPVGYQQSTSYIASQDGFNPQQGKAAPLTPSAGPYGAGSPFPPSALYPLGLLPPVGAAAGLLTNLGQGAQVFDFPQRKIPRTQQASFGIQRELPSHMVLDARWAGNYASRLRAGTTWLNGSLTYPQLQYALNSPSSLSTLVPNPYYGVAAASAPGGCGLFPEVQAIAVLLPFPQYCSGNGASLLGQYNLPVGRNWYNGLEVKLSKRTSHGLEFNLAYTWSKIINGDGYQNGYPFTDPNEIHWISAYDRTHVLTLTGVYEMPFGRGKSFLTNVPRALDYALGGWSLGWVFAAQSGTPVSIDNGDDNYICWNWKPAGGSSVVHWINPAMQSKCGVPVPHIGGTSYTYNVAPQYISQVRNPTVPNLDLSLQKSFKVTERISFSLRGEAFNALNSALLGGPDTTVTDSPANVFYNQTTKHSYWQGFGTVGPSQNNFPRNLRVTGKIIF